MTGELAHLAARRGMTRIQYDRWGQAASILSEHAFWSGYGYGTLYPGPAPTICACGMSPESEPEDDWHWWVEHVATVLVGATPTGWKRDDAGVWFEVTL